VIKVERPGVGDDTRSWGPPFLQNPDGTETRDASYFLALNRGKRSITADLAAPEGQAIVRALAASSDILLENFKVGTLPRFRLGYEDLAAINPRLIYCSMTGFGQTGPKREHAAYDFMIQAMGGLMSVTGERDGLPGSGPQKVGIPIVDILTGMYAAVAVLAALARREETGRGDAIDIAMLDVMVATLTNQAMNYLMTGRTPSRSGNSHPNIQPQDVYPTADGHLVLAVGNDGQFEKLCAAIDRPDLAQDERFRTNAGRVRHLDELAPLLRDVLRHGETSRWVARFDAAGIPCGPINTIPDVFKDSQVVHRGLLTEVQHPTAGPIPTVGSPIRFREAAPDPYRAPPLLGQHTDEILNELKLATHGRRQ
jgi:crotonobetainyl-CoA:carnitine CoA-transferase CaiB-like acyl-CoA transferase